jgi:hypothetical protein
VNVAEFKRELIALALSPPPNRGWSTGRRFADISLVEKTTGISFRD